MGRKACGSKRLAWRAAALAVAAATVASPATAGILDETLAAMAPNSWGRLNTNSFASVMTPENLRPNPDWSPASNISGFSGATWDSKRGNLLVWGGDIGQEEGNEVYVFSGTTGRWDRGSLPNAITTDRLGTTQTTIGSRYAPTSGESWDNVVYLKHVDRMAVVGMSRNGDSWKLENSTNNTGPYFWDPAKANPNAVSQAPGASSVPDNGVMWQNRNSAAKIGSHAEGTSAYFSRDGKDSVYVTDQYGNLWRYSVTNLDPAGDSWQHVGNRPMSGTSGYGSADINTAGTMYLKSQTSTTFAYWDLTRGGTGEDAGRAIEITPTVLDGMAPDFRNMGIQFDAKRNVFLMWDGSGDVWQLRAPSELDTDNDGFMDAADGWTLERIVVGGALRPHIPDDYTGVYGKWIYLAEYDAYVGLIDPVSGDVFLYKPLAAVPEASTLGMLLVGLGGVALTVRRRQRQLAAG
jgi:hypothetical protein